MSGGASNLVVTDYSFVGGGYLNTASGFNSIAMGLYAKAAKNQALVINLASSRGVEDELLESTKDGQFPVKSNSFTLCIDEKEVIVTKKNIKKLNKNIKEKEEETPSP